MIRKLQRSDLLVPKSGRITALWALNLTRPEGLELDYLLGAYELPVRAGITLERRWKTFEFSMFTVDPDTPIDYTKSLFEQPRVSPFTPPILCFQVPAVSSAQMINRIDGCCTMLRYGDLQPEDTSMWAAVFHDGVDPRSRNFSKATA